MKIYASGQAIHLERTSPIDHVTLGRVVGLIDLGGNNADSGFGWCGLKPVVNHNDLLFLLDFPEEVRITTDDDVLVTEGGTVWQPTIEDLSNFDLYLFNTDDF